MVRSAVLVCCLLVNLTACATVGADTSFEEALHAARNNDWETLSRTQARLGDDHPLSAYLDFHRLRAALPELNPTRIEQYQQQYPDSPLPNDIRGLALVAYARAGRWDAARTLYDTPPRAVELRCYALRAELGDHRGRVLEQTRELWLSGFSRPSSCDPLFDAAQEAGVIGQDEIWQRMQLAFDERGDGLMRYLRKMLHGPNEMAGDWLIRLYQDPKQLRQLPGALSDAQRQVLLSAALRRLAYKDTVAAKEIYRQESRALGLTDANLRQRAATRIAWYSTIRGIEENQDWLDQWLAENDNQTLLDQRARRAVIEQDWSHLPEWIARLSQENQADSRWLYWLGRAEQESGDANQAKLHWQQAARQRNFYGFLAADRIGQPYHFGEESAAAVSTDINPPALARITLLREAGEPGLAWKEWNWLIAHSSEPARRQLAQKALKQGWYDLTVQASIQAQTWNVLQWRFPPAHQALFADAGRRYDLDPWLAMAVARRESAFYPHARSPVGALGLMQLMPATARKVARDQGQSAPGTEQLLQPATNIDMGSHYLEELLTKFNGNRILALAAYNAGPSRVGRWLADDPDEAVPVDVWIEAIPFHETRDYVQAVLTYRVLFIGLHDAKQRSAQLLLPRELKTPYSMAMIDDGTELGAR
ncbi:transglycosylase SLT domain-containing protein [Alloalcanivorax mobilis]|uniref:transglycosylase SLT domain-containing protein n=1 Tax=Alloalcanivorax mobilis TaxID=2019569 RepID=UPI000C7874B6|nr:transglycosylase SLT domain-containing protein [Alloalcanivorax mobilis]